MNAIQINLLSHETQAAQTRARHLRAWLSAIIPLLSLLLVLAIVDRVRAAQVENLRRMSDHLNAELVARRLEVRELTAAAAQATLQLQRSDALRAKRSWSALLGLVGQCLPADCWLETLATDPELPSAQSAPAPAATAPASANSAKLVAPATVTIEAPRRLRLAGFALEAGDPLAFVTNLKQVGVFSNVSLERSVLEANDGRSRFRFEIICAW